MRTLILIHRYLGTAIGIVMVGWCLTGIVMMYMRYPVVSPLERLQQLQPLAWRSCCTLGADAIPKDAPVAGIQIENLAAEPVLHVQFADRSPQLIALTDGQAIGAVSEKQAAKVARGLTTQPPRYLGLINYDEWTVSGEFNRARPLHQFALNDAAGTQVYVSATTGRMVQRTTSRQRFWNWVGAVPHWLYFAQLRRHVALWNQVVIWTSLAGCFLALFGLYIGIRQFLHRPAGRWSGYRGLMYWHHVPGLLFGLFALTWVASGLVSMNPWGFLEGAGSPAALEELIGPPISADSVLQAAHALPSASLPADLLAVESSRLWGQLYLVATRADGSRWRLHPDGSPAALGPADWTKIGNALSGAASAAPELITTGDRYYASRPGVPAPFPVVRILDESHGIRYYLDPVTGAPLEVIDADARWYRWLHRGVHTLDLSALLRSRPLWDVLMWILLGGAALLCGTGTWLGWRRYIRFKPRQGVGARNIKKSAAGFLMISGAMENQKVLYLLHDLHRRLDGKATLGSIARRAGQSRFQIHREFHRMMGESPRGFIERVRLEQAAARLIGSKESVFEIALGAGFVSHEVFTRAFRRKFGLTPLRYRKAALPRTSQAARADHLRFTSDISPCIRLFHLSLRPSNRKSPMPTLSVTRQQYPGQAILLIRRSIPRAELQPMLAECFGKLFGHGAKAGLPIAGWPVARYLSVGPGLWTVEAAMPVAAPVAGTGDMEAGTLPAGPVAVGVHAGLYDQLPETYAAIEKWMAANGVRANGAPWESYVNDPTQHPDPADWRTEVYWPIAD